MKSRCYKIKKKDTAEFWSGYSSCFTSSGSVFNTMEMAAYALRQQLRLKHSSITHWLATAEIVEYEIITNEIDKTPALSAVVRAKFHDRISKEYGRTFVKLYRKLRADPVTRDKYKFAILVDHEHYKDFRQTLKQLGYSSRNYKKIEDWLWFESEDVVMLAKLLEGHKHVVNLSLLEVRYEAELLRANVDFGVSTEPYIP